jgi:hypothetical protein
MSVGTIDSCVCISVLRFFSKGIVTTSINNQKYLQTKGFAFFNKSRGCDDDLDLFKKTALMNRTEFFVALWNQYIQVTPQADSIHALFNERGEDVINDHVAFRTFDIKGFDLDRATELLATIGYEAFDSYTFPDKHLRAKAYRVPDDSNAPKVFFSELIRSELGEEAQAIINKVTRGLGGELTLSDLTGRYPFHKPTVDEYQSLANASEYAGWLSTMGYQANHFTVNVNALQTFELVEEVIELLLEHQYQLNEVGGRIKGTPADLLVQASTIADQITFEFSDGAVLDIPSCFYEFAHRFTSANGELFQGFVPNNANAIFESTDRR